MFNEESDKLFTCKRGQYDQECVWSVHEYDKNNR